MWLGRDHRVPQAKCPLCGHKLDAASGINTDASPDPGDYSVCIGCASPLIYRDDLTLRPLTAPEMAAMHPVNRAEVEAGMAAARALDRRKRR